MAKYTDEQIKKALELITGGVGSAKRELCIAIHDLINRQEAEKAELQDEIKCEKETNKHLNDEYIALLKKCNCQEAEIERLKNRQKPNGASGYKIENGKVVFFTTTLGGYRREYENLEEVVKVLNELLHEAYSKDEILFYYNCAIEDLKTAKSEAVKELLYKIEKQAIPNEDDVYWVELDDIYDIVKEMVGESK